MAGSGQIEDAGFLANESGQPEKSGGRGSSRQRAESALRELFLARFASEGFRYLSEFAQLLWRLQGSGRGDDRGREIVLRALLRDEQRGDGDCRRREHRGGVRESREILQRGCATAGSAEAGRHRTAANR